jgi:hypothetical protein
MDLPIGINPKVLACWLILGYHRFTFACNWTAALKANVPSLAFAHGSLFCFDHLRMA